MNDQQHPRALELLRETYRFRGYIHAKTIPGADPALVHGLGLLADRLSVNIELPSEASLKLLAPDKQKAGILRPMGLIARTAAENRRELTVYRHAPVFAPAGQSTQMIVGASPESDYQILQLTEGLYQKYRLKRVFFSAYIPVCQDERLPALDTKPPLLREHRLYQADWLLRYYQFSAGEILSPEAPNFDPWLDPKCNWALHHLDRFPVDVERCEYEMLLRVPGIGPKSAKRIRSARRHSRLGLEDLRRIGVVLHRARYFIVCSGYPGPGRLSRMTVARALLDPGVFEGGARQLSLFDDPAGRLTGPDSPALPAAAAGEEAAAWLARRM